MNFTLDSDTIVGYSNAEFCRTGITYQVRDVEVGQFFQFCRENGHKILVSEKVLGELRRKFRLSREDVEMYLDGVGVEYRVLPVTPEVTGKERVMRGRGVHRGDATHAAFALAHKAKLVTYNRKDYEAVEDLIDVGYPSDFY